jgi:glycosyltransferase involved in cell wall biosynthesis
MCDKILIVPAWYPCSFFKEQADLLRPDCDVRILSGAMHQIGFAEALVKSCIGKCTMERKLGYTLVDFYYITNLRSIFITKQLEYLTKKIGEIILNLFGGEKPDVIHIQSISDIAVFVTRWAKRQGIRVVLTEHILFVRHEINRFSKLRENLYNEVDEVMCVSNYLYRNLLTSGFKMKHVSVIGNFVNDKYIQQDRSSNKNGRVLFVANHYHDKGLDILFEVIKQLQNKIDCVVDIVGLDGTSHFNEVSTIDDMVKKCDIEHNICLLGKIAHDDLLKLYSQYSVLLTTSTSETFGLAVAEAIMCGTKVVCTDSGGIRDFVNDKNGIVVGLNNVGELVEAVQKVLENSKVSQSESQVLCEQYGSKQYREKMFASYIK